MDEDTHGRDKFNQTFRNEDRTEVKPCVGTSYDDLDDVLYDVVEGHFLSFYFLGDEADIRLALECAFEGNVTCRTPHEADEVPVFLGGVSVALDVTDEFGIGLTSGVETERGLDHLVLEVPVDGLRTTDNLDTALFLEVVLSEHASVGVRVVTTDDDYGLDAEFLTNLNTVIELPSLFEFGTTGTDDIEAAGVTVLVDDGAGEFLILTVNQTGRTTEEAVQFILRVEGFQTVIQTADHIVTAGSLTAGENHTDVKRFGANILASCGFERDEGQTVGVREEFLDLVLVSYRLCFLAFNEAYSALQSHRHFRLVVLACNL